MPWQADQKVWSSTDAGFGLIHHLMVQEDLNLLLGPLTARRVVFDDYRLGECVEERDRLQMKRRWANARFKRSVKP